MAGKANKQGRDGFVARVQGTIAKHAMLPARSRVLVAVSGGPDSCALLLALHELAKDLSLALFVAHFNHGLRKGAAEEDATFVARLARRLKLTLKSGRADVSALAASAKLGIEEAARTARWEFLRQAAKESAASVIAAGHTADDCVETILINLLRGTGTDGLRGIVPKAALESAHGSAGPPTEIVRPLIEMTRQETEAFCRQEGIVPRLDESNLERGFLRNRLRLDLLPLLEKEYCPSVKANLLRLGEIARDESDYWKALAEDELERLIRGSQEAEIRMEGARLLALHPALQRRVFRAAVERVMGDLSDLGLQHVDDALSLLKRRTSGARRVLPGGACVRTVHGELVISDKEKTRAMRITLRQLLVPGTTPLPEIGKQIRVELLPASATGVPAPAGEPQSGMRDEASVDFDALEGELHVRSTVPGDRFCPLGMTGRKKLQDFFVDGKVDANERAGVPIVCTGEAIVWVAGYRLDDRFKLTDRTRTALKLSLCDLEKPASAIGGAANIDTRHPTPVTRLSGEDIP